MMNIFGKRSDLSFSRKPAIERRTEPWFRLRMSGILFAAQHGWTTLYMGRPIFVGSYLICRSRGGLSANEKEEQIIINVNWKQSTKIPFKTQSLLLHLRKQFMSLQFLRTD